MAGEAGVDEAGCGSLMGDLVAAAVILPDDFGHAAAINDSKKLSAQKREALAVQIEANARVGVGVVTSVEIDENTFAWARRAVFLRALDALGEPLPASIVVDGTHFFDGYRGVPHTLEAKADAKYVSVGAASIIAKVTRDRSVHKLCEAQPELADRYGWRTNMGYPTKVHRDGLACHGPSGYHRRSFGPCKAV